MTIPADYVSQIDEHGSGRERCAGACLASLLLDVGWQSDPAELMRVISDQAGWTDHGATSAQLIEKAAEYGFVGRTFSTWHHATEALDAGEWCLLLLDNRNLFPRSYPAGVGWNATHWLRIKSVLVGGDLAYTYDPLTYLWDSLGRLWQGPTLYTVESLRAGVAATPYPEAGLLFTR